MNESEGNSGEPASLSRPTSQLAGLATRRASNRQRRIWSRRVTSWDQHGSASLGAVTSAVIGVAAVQPGAKVLDLGCGNGQISIPLARRGANVLGRYLLRVQERPISMTSWTALLEKAGFIGITASAVVAEAGLVTAARPGPSGRGVAGPLAGARGSTAWPPMNQ